MTPNIAPFSVFKIGCIHWFSGGQPVLSLCEDCGREGKLEIWESGPWTGFLWCLCTSFIVDGYDDASFAELMWWFNGLRYAKGLADPLAQGQA